MGFTAQIKNIQNNPSSGTNFATDITYALQGVGMYVTVLGIGGGLGYAKAVESGMDVAASAANVDTQGDAASAEEGGMNMGMIMIMVILVIVILGLVVYLGLRHKEQQMKKQKRLQWLRQGGSFKEK